MFVHRRSYESRLANISMEYTSHTGPNTGTRTPFSSGRERGGASRRTGHKRHAKLRIPANRTLLLRRHFSYDAAERLLPFFNASQAFLQSGHQIDHVALGGFGCRCLTFLPFRLGLDQFCTSSV